MFQFPTGWNSTISNHYLKWLFPVSIPNGMEFYGIVANRLRFFEKFQFPTGWNSTLFLQVHLRQI